MHQRQRLTRVEPAVIERAAGDRAGEPRAIGFEQALDVVDRGETARGDDRNLDRLGQRHSGRDVEALHHAVAADVGIDQRRHAGVLEATAEVDRGDVGGARPAVDRDAAVARVDAHRDAAGIEPRRLAHESRVLDRGGADDDPRHALFQPADDRLHVAHAAAELHLHLDRGEDAVDGAGVHRLAGEGPVKIDQMQPAEAVPFEDLRLRRRVSVEHRRLGHVAAHQPHALTGLEVDRGEQDHGRHLRKLAIRARPSFWLFSGWNWVPTTLSRATIAVIGPP